MTGRVSALAMAVVLCACGAAWGDTVISGNITADETWTVAGSPYIVTNLALVKFGHSLTIEPGVTVRFNAGRSLSTDPSGSPNSIVALGTADHPITFTSNLPGPTAGSWLKVSVDDSLSSSAFAHCVFEYASYGLYLIETDAPIEHCAFRDCQTGILLDDSAPPITSCDITDCTSEGIRGQNAGSVPVIFDCNISNPDAAAMNVRLVDYNLGSIVTITARQNWWGTDDPTTIAAKIWDYSDNIVVRGVVDYDEYLHAPGVELTSWGSIKALFRD